MNERKARRTLPTNQILLLLMGIVIAYLAADFARQVAISHQRREELLQVEQKIETILEEGQRLGEKRTYIQSPQAAEEWARQNGWAKEGEQPIVIVGPQQPAFPDESGEEEAQGTVSPRQAWWELFFGKR
jgi:hypothetical protein